MKRRDSIKTLLIGGLAGTALGTQACKKDINEPPAEIVLDGGYGRTAAEKIYDEKLRAEVFLTDVELTTIATLCDIILPATTSAGSAIDAKVPAFIEFIVKDLPTNQLPIRGGLMWLDGESNKRFNTAFSVCSKEQQLQIIEDIAYPDPDNKNPEMAPGIAFFSRMRNLTLTGYYTTKIGIDDLGYVGNSPNLWDGVPQEVLDKHGLAYPESWMPKFVNHETRATVAEWDSEGNLLT